jgi:phosphate transport system permease protein
MSDAKSFTNRTRTRKTKPSVRWIDFAAKWGIVLGGIGTIAVVLLVCFYLAWVTLPLFLPPEVESATPLGTAPWGDAKPVAVGSDDQQQLGWALLPDGRFVTYRLDTAPGERTVSDVRLVGDDRPTAFSTFAGSTEFAIGTAANQVRRGKIVVSRQVRHVDDLPEAWRVVPPGGLAIVDGQLLRRSELGDDAYTLRITAELDPPLSLGADGASGSSVALLDQSVRTVGPILCTLSSDAKLRVHAIRNQLNMATGQTTAKLVSNDVPYTPRADGAAPQHLLISGVGDDVFLVWRDGLLRRYSVRDPAKAALVEEVDLVPETTAEVTAFGAMIGKATLVVGDSLGRVAGWFRIERDATNVASTSPALPGDGAQLVRAHKLPQAEAAVSLVAPSFASRLLSVGYADGRLRIFNMTTEAQLLELTAPATPATGGSSTTNTAVLAAALAPRDDGLVGDRAAQLAHWRINPRHPEVSFAALFSPIWYEGTPRPQHVWQSSSGSDSYEPKYGFGPLVFGTCKAAFYSLLFAVPIALCAAIYTSEFLTPKAKSYIKPTIELMAGLPSVVLGFMAALVLAPIIEPIVGSLLAALVVLPFLMLLGAHLWQLLPRDKQVAWDGQRFWFIGMMLLLGPIVAWFAGPGVERIFFAGNVRDWLSGRIGSGVGGWTFMLLPFAAATMFYLVHQYVAAPLRRRLDDASDFQIAASQLGIFLAGSLGTLAVAGLGGMLLVALGFDPRESLVGEYKQLNTMIVGLAMGFAIIPIIFTIAEDALSTVPTHLRSASLGAGATKWQTAVRIIVPTAMSGLFSAVMVGLGRAVGETMIVLMAAGNTAIIDVNVFNGFRTLPANIAVELPEAVRDSTHYRTLFLAALVLFALTFVLNTVAELVRQRFRKRAYQL